MNKPPHLRVGRVPAPWVPNLDELVTTEERKQRRNKYGAIKTEYNGRTYASRLEAEVSQMLDTLRNAADPRERVVYVCYQVPYTLVDKRGKDRAIVYRADFLVRIGCAPDSRLYVIEAKGKETDVWRIKKRLFEERYPDIPLRVVKKPAEVVAISQE